MESDLAEAAVFVGDDGHGFVQSKDGVHQLDDRVRQDVALHVFENVGKHGTRHGHLNVIRGFDTDRHRVRQQDLSTVGEHGKHVVDTGNEPGLVEGTRLNHRSREVALTGEEARSVEGPNALEDASALEGLTLHVSTTTVGERVSTRPLAVTVPSNRYLLAFSVPVMVHTEVFSGVMALLSRQSETLARSSSLTQPSMMPRPVQVPLAVWMRSPFNDGCRSRELARHRDAVGLEGPVLGERHLTRPWRMRVSSVVKDPLLVTTVWLSV